MSLQTTLRNLTDNALAAIESKQATEAEQIRKVFINASLLAQQEAESICDGLDEKLMNVAGRGASQLDVFETDFSWSLSNGRTFTYTSMEELEDDVKKHLFSRVENLRDYYILKYIVEEVGLTAVLDYRHDGVGMKSWYMIMVKW